MSFDPNLTIKCLSIKDSVGKFNQTLIVDAVANPDSVEARCKLDMATVFFGAIFGGDVAPRVMSAIIAICIFGKFRADLIISWPPFRIHLQLEVSSCVFLWALEQAQMMAF